MQIGDRVRWRIKTPWGMELGHKAGELRDVAENGWAVVRADQDKGTEYLNPFLVIHSHQLELEAA